MQSGVEDRIRRARGADARGIGAGRRGAARAGAARAPRAGARAAAGRSRCGPSTPGSSQLLRLAPLEMLESLGLQPRHGADRGRRRPARGGVPRFPCRRAARPGAARRLRRHGRDARPAHARPVARPRLAAADRDRPGRRGRHAREQRRAGFGMVGRARGHGRPGAGRARRRLAARALLALAAAWQRHKNKTPRDARGGDRRGATRCRPRARCFEAIDSALLTQTGTVRKNLPESPALAEAGEFLSRLQPAGRPARRPPRAPAHGPARAARCSPRIAEHKRRHGLADMADLERLRAGALRDGDLAGWMQEKLDLRVRHLLIDEFQDTSPLQWHALHAWLASYAGAGGGASGQQPPSLFIVGDPKQSLYRFRGAEPRVFEAAADFVVDAFGGHRLACDHTWRSAPRVIEAINRRLRDRRRRGRVRRLPRAQHGAVGAARRRRLAAASRRSSREEPRRPASDSTQTWRDTLTTPRLVPDEVLREQEAARAADLLRRWLAAGDATTGRDDAPGPQARIAAPRRRRLAGARRAARAGLRGDADGCGRARRTWSRCSTCWRRRSTASRSRAC